MAITTVSSHVVSVNAIQGTLIADNAITAVHIATNAVSGTLIADNAITAVHVAQNSITVTQLADDCVESDKIADGVITTNHLNKAMISSQTEVTPVAGDFVLLGDTSDSNNLKKAPLTLLLNSNVDLSTKLNLSGGTLTGDLILDDSDGDRFLTLDKSSTGTSGILLKNAGNNKIKLLANASEEFELHVNNALAMYVNENATVGISTTPKSTNTFHADMFVGPSLYIANYTSGANQQSIFGNNTYYNSGYKAVTGDTAASMVNFSQGNVTFDTASTVSTDAAQSFTTKLYIKNDGNVGIGTASPTNILHTSTSSNTVARFESTDATAIIRINDTDDSFYITTAGQKGSIGGNASVHSDNININLTNGNVGIGDTSPDNKLSIRAASTIGTVNGHIMLTGDSATTGQGPQIVFSESGGSSDFAGASVGYARTGSNGIGDLIFGTRATSGDANTAPTERMRIDSSGDTRFAANATGAALIKGVSGNQADRDNSGYPQYTFVGNEGTGMRRVSSNILALDSSGAERMRIDDSGDVLIGQTSQTGYGFAQKLVVGDGDANDGITIQSGSTHQGNLAFNHSDGTTAHGRISYQHQTNYMSFFVNNDEKVRFNTNGTMYVTPDLGAHTNVTSFAHSTYAHAGVFGANSVPDGTLVVEDYDVSSGIGNTVLKCYLRDQDPATSATFIAFADGGGAVGSVTHNDDGGGVSFNTTSDYRLKENVNYTWDATTLLKQLKPAKFNFKRNPAKTVQGMLAHEVMDIVPSSVRGDKDHMMEIGTITDSDGNVVSEGVYEHFCKEGQTWEQTGTEPLYQELDYSRLVPLLVKTIQELEARIATLEG